MCPSTTDSCWLDAATGGAYHGSMVCYSACESGIYWCEPCSTLNSAVENMDKSYYFGKPFLLSLQRGIYSDCWTAGWSLFLHLKHPCTSNDVAMSYVPFPSSHQHLHACLTSFELSRTTGDTVWTTHAGGRVPSHSFLFLPAVFHPSHCLVTYWRPGFFQYTFTELFQNKFSMPWGCIAQLSSTPIPPQDFTASRVFCYLS